MPSSLCSPSEPLDLMLVVGGYNSSNTCNLARICAASVRTYHIADPDCMMSADEIRHRPVGAPSTTAGDRGGHAGWLPYSGPLKVGLTAGASTPNNIVGEVIRRLERFCGLRREELGTPGFYRSSRDNSGPDDS